METSVKYRVAGKVRVRQEDDDVYLIYHDEKGYETNAVGTEIVKICGDPTTLTEICNHIGREFDAPFEVIVKDVSDVIEHFVANGILERMDYVV